MTALKVFEGAVVASDNAGDDGSDLCIVCKVTGVFVRDIFIEAVTLL